MKRFTKVCLLVVLKEDAVRLLDATFPIGPPLNPTSILSNAIDRRVNSTASQCFTSAQKTGGWASIVIPHSMVTHVALLNSDDEKSKNYLVLRFYFLITS